MSLCPASPLSSSWSAAHGNDRPLHPSSKSILLVLLIRKGLVLFPNFCSLSDSLLGLMNMPVPQVVDTRHQHSPEMGPRPSAHGVASPVQAQQCGVIFSITTDTAIIETTHPQLQGPFLTCHQSQTSPKSCCVQCQAIHSFSNPLHTQLPIGTCTQA